MWETCWGTKRVASNQPTTPFPHNPSGLRPLPESYVALIIAFTTVRDAAAARAVLASMARAADDARPGWLALCAGLFRAGLGEDAAAALERGKRDGWHPDADLYALYLDWLVLTPAGVDSARRVFEIDMAAAAVPPDTRHGNAMIYGDAHHLAPHIGMETLEAMSFGAFGAGCRPTAASHAIVMEASLAAIATGGANASSCHEYLEEAMGVMVHRGIAPDKRVYAAMVRKELANGALDNAFHCFTRMVRLAREGEATTMLPDDALGELAVGLAAGGVPTDLLDVLIFVARDERTLPPSALAQLDGAVGHTIIGCWLPGFVRAARSRERPPGLLDAPPTEWGHVADDSDDDDAYDSDDDDSEEDEDSTSSAYTTINNVLIELASGSAVSEVGGAPIPVSRATLGELTAELLHRGLSTQGRKPDLYLRIQKARTAARAYSMAAAPPLVAPTARDKAKKKKKDSRVRAARARRAARLAKDDDDTDVPLSDDDDDDDDIEDDDDDVPVAARLRRRVDDDEPETWFRADDDDDDDDDGDDDEPSWRRGQGKREVALDAGEGEFDVEEVEGRWCRKMV